MPTERSDVVERAAAMLRARLATGRETDIVLHERLNAALKIEVKERPASDVMLGGAYSRLQLWAWARPEFGGIIWLRDNLDAETRRFAIAHELGHYILHRGEGINVHAACSQQEIDQQADSAALRTEERQVQEYSPRVRRELEANAFAAELLAPRAEVRRLFTSSPQVATTQIAAHFHISHLLAGRRLLDALLAPARPVEYTPGSAMEASDRADEQTPSPGDLIARLDASQQAAARAEGPALVVAGPGTGKTATLVGRVAYLVGERHVPPEKILALTFSNRAAGEMRERLTSSGLPGERMPVMTIHAFAASLLREYASHVPHAPDEAELASDFQILDQANAFLLMEDLLGDLALRYYRSLGNPTAHLETLLIDFSQARDNLLSPDAYRTMVEAMRESPDDERGEPKKGQRKTPRPQDGPFTREEIERARERAAAYAVWLGALRRRGLVDFGGLILRAVELLRADETVLADVRMRYPQMLVDEFQDTNRAAAELLMLVAGESGAGLWVVGDRNQSIYRFRGASPGNLRRLVDAYPDVRVLSLRRCYRAVPDIVQLGSAMAARMAELAHSEQPNHPDQPNQPNQAPSGAAANVLRRAMQSLQLEPVRAGSGHAAIQRAETFENAAHERAGLATAIAHYHSAGFAYSDQAILCRTHKQARQIAATLAREGVPASQTADFFERPEVKDAITLLLLATGPDARGLLRAAPLLVSLGYPAPTRGELAAVTDAYSSRQRRLPDALRNRTILSQLTAVSSPTREGFATLGAVASEMRDGGMIGLKLAAFLLRPGGYAWRLARIADGRDTPQSQGPLGGTETPARAQQALAALGELVRLAWRFDARWAQDAEFQARLRRVVTHRRTSRPTEPDTLTPAPQADVAMTETAGTLSSTVQPDESVPAVRCFLHYLRALRATDVAIPVPVGEGDAVHVLTLHQSKGLEFPVVLLPGLARGQFPTGAHSREEVCPPGFRESDAPGEREAEDRCLFYVGLTRARDVVLVTRAQSYSTTSSGAAKTAEASPLLALLDGAPGWMDASSPLAEHEYERLLATAADLADTDEDERDDESDTSVAAPLAPDTPPGATPRFTLHELEQYRACPRQYKYAQRYHLLDPAESAVYRFHRFVRQGTRKLRDVRAESPTADWANAEARLRSLWEESGPTEHAYDAFYWQAAETILREEWQAITGPAGAAMSENITLAERLTAHLRTCDVEVIADRIIADRVIASAYPGDAEPSLTMLVRLHTGRPHKDDLNDLALPLYALAYQQAHPEVPVQIVVAYAGNALWAGQDSQAGEASRETSAGAYDPRNQVNVTLEARKAADRYREAPRRQRSKLDKLDEAAMGIRAGQFAPKPEERRCAACAYCYICPADPDDDPATSLLAPSSTPADATSQSAPRLRAKP